MPGRILDRLLPLVPIVVPPAAEQPHEKNIVSSLDFPQYRNFSLEGRAFRLEIRDKRERCTGFVSWIVKKSCRPATDIIYLKFYLTILPTDDRLNFHESWNAEISFIYRNIHIRFPRIELNFISTNPREGRRVDNERGEKGNNERHARRKIPSHGDIPLSTRAYARFTDWPDSMNRNAPSLQSTVQPSDQPSNRPTNQPASQPTNPSASLRYSVTLRSIVAQDSARCGEGKITAQNRSEKRWHRTEADIAALCYPTEPFHSNSLRCISPVHSPTTK